MFKWQIAIDRHSPRLIPNQFHFSDPPHFSLPSTFNEKEGTGDRWKKRGKRGRRKERGKKLRGKGESVEKWREGERGRRSERGRGKVIEEKGGGKRKKGGGETRNRLR
jgi:hypothetical protein